MSDRESTRLTENAITSYAYVLMKRRWLIVAFAITLTLTVLVHSLLSPRIYSSTATVEISPKAPVVLDVRQVAEMVPQSMGQIQNYYETQYEIIKSDSVLERAVQSLKNEGITDFDNHPRPANRLRSLLRVSPRTGTHLVSVTVEYTDPEKASRFANTIAQAYMDANLERSLNASQQALEWLKEQQTEYRKAQIASDDRVQKFRAEHSLVAADGSQFATEETLARLQTALSEAHTRRVVAEATQTELSRLRTNGGLALAAHLARSNPVVQNLLGRLEELKEERTRMGTRYREQHPEYQRINQELQGLERQIRGHVDTLVGGQRAELELAIREEQDLDLELRSLEEKMSQLGQNLIELRFLEQEAQRNKQFYQSLDQRMAEVGLSQFMQGNNVRVIDAAEPNPSPVRPTVAINVLSALIAGVLGGAAIAVLLESIDATIQSREDIEHGVGVELLGVVPKLNERQLQALTTERDRSVFVHAVQRSNVAECMRSIRTNILLRSHDKPIRRIVVTSAAPREGKSFVSTNLAAILAMNGSRVLAIDGDLRRPALHRRFQVPNDIGLSNVLAGECALVDAVQPSHVPGLHLLVAGPSPSNPSETLGLERTRALIDSIQGYDLILIDSPPMNVVSDALVLASIADAAIFIVEASTTRRSVVRQSCRRLHEVNGNLLGAIVNKVDVERSGYTYDYYYSDYSYYNLEPDEQRKLA
jgi:succinoglycan biosynthesis transport protein ExoP